MADGERELFVIINELLESSSSSDDDIENTILLKEERPKIKNYVDIVNEYSDKEVRI